MLEVYLLVFLRKTLEFLLKETVHTAAQSPTESTSISGVKVLRVLPMCAMVSTVQTTPLVILKRTVYLAAKFATSLSAPCH
jgi:hypothetical protein